MEARSYRKVCSLEVAARIWKTVLASRNQLALSWGVQTFDVPFVQHTDDMFAQVDIADREAMEKVFAKGRFDAIVNLAAQAGVRYSIENPYAYVDANVVGFMNILEGARGPEVERAL